MSLRVTAAIIACKAVRTVARILKKGGTAKPGEIALKICPDLLSVVSKGVDTVVVTGTNGKTSSCRMLERAFAEAGIEPVVNRSGANLMSGIVTEFVMDCDLRGRCRKKAAVMECDEGWTRRVLPAMKPKAFLVTNLFQDQVDRYGDVSNTLAAVRAGVEGSPDTVLVLNADDPVTATLGRGVKNPVVWYGLEQPCGTECAAPDAREIRTCMACGAELEYNYVNYAHLGGWRCPGCGAERLTPDVAVTSLLELGADGSRVTLRASDGEKELYVNLPALYNVSNAAGCVAACEAMGLGAVVGRAAAERFQCGFGRMEKFDLGAGARMILIKNAAGCNQVLEFLARQEGSPFRVAFITNNRPADGTDVSWLADARFDLLAEMPELRGVTCSGICAAEVREKLLEKGVRLSLIDTQTDYAALAEAVAGSDVPVFLLPSYTGMMEFRPYLARRVGGKEFWE